MSQARCRHGRTVLACSVCGPEATARYTFQPGQLTAGLDPKPLGYHTGTPAAKRQRLVPDHLFVCDQCYRGYRLARKPNPDHAACNDRLELRRKEMPLTA